ncbi:MAG: endonuclease VIII [Burkholderiales bacterium]
MPEGPEIKRSADQLSAALIGRIAVAVEFSPPQLKCHGPVLTGRYVSAVEARGKAMLVHFEHGWTIYSHNQLYGDWLVRSAGERPNTTRSLRVAIQNHAKSALLYSATDIEVLRTDDVAKHRYIRKLGVDLLADDTTVQNVLAQVEAPQFQRRNLAGLLLDQGFLAGVGNYLRSDILFAAKLHPSLSLAELTTAQKLALADYAFKLARQSYETRGVTNDLERVALLKAQSVTRSRFRHLTFQRDGETCYECATTIERVDYGGRGCFICSVCQPRARSD